MGESEPDVLCAPVCKHLSKQEPHLALRCCNEVLAEPPIPTTSSISPFITSPTGPSTSSQDCCVHVLALLRRVSTLIQQKKFSEAEEDCKNVMWLQGFLGDGVLEEILLSMSLDGRLTDICSTLFNCDSTDLKQNEGNMRHFKQLVLLLTESQVSSSAARVSDEDSAEGTLMERHWKHRAPPRGVQGIDEYTLCLRFIQGGECSLGELCVSAHSHGELLEWRQRLLCSRLQGRRARRVRETANSYSESLTETWMRNLQPRVLVSSSVLGVSVDCVPGFHQTVDQKHCSVSWILQLECNPPRTLCRVALLGELHSALFCITGVEAGGIDSLQPHPLSQPQREWSCGGRSNATEHVYQVTVVLTAQVFGSFRQTIAFDFGSEPLLLQTVSAELNPPFELDPHQQGELQSVHWDAGCKQVTVVDFLPRDVAQLDQTLLRSYQIPAAADQLFTRSALDQRLTSHNYRSRLHDLLYIEENAQYMELRRLSLQTSLRVVTPPPVSGLRSVARPLLPGQLFAELRLSGTGVSRDTAGGRLVWDTVDSVLILPVLGQHAEAGGRERVYEALLEERLPERMLLRLSEECGRDLRLQPEQDLQVELQFQLNRLPLCEMHFGVDSLQEDCTLLFPEFSSVGESTSLCSVDGTDARLNEQQREALRVIMAPLSLQWPPVLLCGPPGTGKSFTLVQATRALLREDSNRVLLCSHTEAAADVLTNDIQALMGHSLPQGWLLRLQGCSRPVKSTAAASHRSSGLALGTVELQQPGREDVNRSRAVICTVRQTKQLIHLSLDTGCFTHILVDEASSAPECETVMALSLAGRSTRVVLAGDPAQLPPLVYSEFARERGLQRPLLERLSACYPQGSSCVVQLMEQYSSQQHIVRLVSELFYQGELKASSKQPTHKDFFPLSFFTAWGTDKSSCGYLNYAEVLEVVEQVEDLCKKWPVSWGKLEEGSVGVLTPYPRQAMWLRAELQRRKLGCATVQTLVFLPGRSFRALFLSTVRTRHTLKQRVMGGARRREPSLEEEESIEDRELGFLSSPRTLRSVLLCAQSLLAVVGDPVALCTVGKCRRIWERFLSACDAEGSLHGTNLAYVLEQVDMVESRGCDILNPMAPEFVPRGPPRLALTNRLPASLPHITVKRSSSPHFKQPFQREHYGPLGPGVPQSTPPYLLALSPGRPCVYRRSPSPPPRLRPLGRAGLLCDPYRSRLLLLGRLPFACPTYANRMTGDPRTVACQAAVACNFHLLQKPASPPLAGPSPYLHHSPPQSYRTSPDCRVHRVTAGRGDIGAGFGATCLCAEADGEEQFSGTCGFRHSRSSGPSHLEQCCPSALPVSQPISSSTSPPPGCDPTNSSIRMSPELGRPNYYGPLTRSLCQSSKLQNGGHGSAGAGDEERSRYSPWAEQISPPFSPLPHSTVTSLRSPGVTPLLSPRTRPACSPGYRTENSWGCLGSSTSAPGFQLLHQEQQRQGGTELHSTPGPGAAERAESDWTGGRRLYQRSPSPLWSAEESPLSQTDPPSSPYVWDEERSHTHHQEKVHVTSGSVGVGGVESSALGRQMLPNDPLTLQQDLGCGNQDRAYYSYFP